MKVVKIVISFMLAVVLMSEAVLPVCAEETSSDTKLEQDKKEEDMDFESPGEKPDETNEDINQETAENDSLFEEPGDILEESAAPAFSVESTAGMQEKAGFALTVEYPEKIECNKEITFKLNASGGSGNYVYRIHSLMVHDGSEWVSVYDISKGNNSGYSESNEWKFTFYASGTYYIRFNAMDKGVVPMQTVDTGFFGYRLDIDDPAYPTVEQRVETITKQCVQECGMQASDFDKALWLHDWIVDHAKYDNDLKYCSAEGVLARGIGTCESYHRAYVMLLNKMGIQTGRITGNGHVWTAVKMDGAWYHVDTTWDGQAAKKDDYQYMYFGLDDKIMSLVHSDHQSAKPGYEARSLENNYFVKTAKIKKWSDPFIDKIRQKIADGETEIQFPIPYNTVGGNYHYTNVIYNLVAYQLSKEDWDGIKIDFSFEKSAYQVNGKLICRTGNRLTIQKNEDESVMTVKLVNATVSSNATVSFPVWGEMGGQNDIIWYQGKKTAEGTYEAKVPVSSHKETGKYNVHVYVNQNGRLEALTSGEISIAGLTADEIICNEAESSKEDGKYRIEVKNVSSPADISGVQIPVWSDENGQDDIRWYTAKKSGNVWYADVEVRNHKYRAGLYHAHAYATDSRGIMQGVGALEFTVEKMDVNGLKIEKNGAESVITVTLSNSTAGGNAQISFPVWGEEKGQNDIVWYQGRKTGEGTYEAKVPVSSHKETGKYNVHVYANQNGRLEALTSGEISIAGLTADEIICNEAESSKENGKYRIEVKNVSSPADISSVQIPVWSDENGQDDIRWYTAKKSGNVWYADVEVRNHKYRAGLYHAHAYATDSRGIMQGVGALEFTVEKMDVNGLKIEKNGAESVITVTLSNSTAGENAQISFPVWGEEKGQNDIVWYQGRKTGEGTYEAKVPVSSHKETGKYNVHVYANQNGRLEALTSGEISIAGLTADEIICNEAESSKENGKYRIEVKNVSSPADISSVQIPVWSDKNGQDDIRWYDAKNDGDTWYADVDICYHKFDGGAYHAHAYVRDSRGIFQCVDKLDFNVEEVERNNLQISMDEGHRYMTILLNAATTDGMVQFPVWGTDGGQNDIVWYNGTRIAPYTYKTIVDVSRHKEAGEYIIHAYGQTNGTLSFLKAGTVVVEGISDGRVKASADKEAAVIDVKVSDINGPAVIEKILIPT